MIWGLCKQWAHEASRSLSPQRPPVQFQASECGICGRQNDSGAGFSRSILILSCSLEQCCTVHLSAVIH